MITFNDFKKMHRDMPPGRARKNIADQIMLNTWWQDIQAQTCYIYDYYHDQKSEEALKLNDLHPQNDPYKTPLDIKFIRHVKQTYDKDPVTFWLQMKPGQLCNQDYYDEALGKRYGALFPVGNYVDIRHEDGTYNKWLIVDKANYNGNQFPTYEILRCDFVVQWIFKGHKYQCPAVLRSQNSYNSGLWLDFKIQTVEDQQKFAVPMTKETETLFYNIRVIIDNKIEYEPRAWLISKVNRISPNGICRITLTQDIFDQHRDYIEKNEDGEIIGMWANYFNSNVEPTFVPEDVPTVGNSSRITCSGKPVFKIGGSAKTFTVKFYDRENQEITDHDVGSWAWYIDGTPLPNTLMDYTISGNSIKIKFLGDDSYIGKVITIKNTSDILTSTIDVEITAL